MNEVNMSEWGQTLTGRKDGKKTFDEIISKYSPPFILNFYGVIALGSSFGDEVVVKLAALQKNKIVVKNANRVIKICLNAVIEEANIALEFDP